MRSDIFEYNSSNRVHFDKYLKRDCKTKLELQLSVKYFLRHCFESKIFSYLSDHVNSSGMNGLDDLTCSLYVRQIYLVDLKASQTWAIVVESLLDVLI